MRNKNNYKKKEWDDTWREMREMTRKKARNER